MREVGVADIAVALGDAEQLFGFVAAPGIRFDDGELGTACQAVALEMAPADAAAPR